MEAKDLLTTKITQEVIDFINTDGRSLRSMIEEILEGEQSSEVTRKIKNLRKKISRAGYKFDDETKKFIEIEEEKEDILFKKNEHNSEKDSSISVEKKETQQAKVKAKEQKKETNSQKTPSKKELIEQLNAYQEKEEKEKLLQEQRNTIRVPKEEYFVTLIHEAAVRVKEDEKTEDGVFSLCFFGYTDVLDEFKKVEECYYYVKNSFIVEALIDYASVYFKRDNLKILEYQQTLVELMQNKKAPKKKVNYKLSQEAVRCLNKLKEEFPLVSKQTDLMNLILLAFSSEFNKKRESEKTKN